MSCGRQLEWIDLIPVFSWLALFGRCRRCGSRISIQYPLVEATTAILFGLIGYWALRIAYPYTVPLVFVYLGIAALLIAIATYDIRHTIIPDQWVYLFAALAFSSQFLIPSPSPSLFSILCAGPIAASPLFFLWLVSSGQWMGLGDAKLALGIGWLLGPLLGFFSIMGGFVLGAAVSICILIPLSHLSDITGYLGITRLSARGRGLTMKSEVAFGPFLIASCLIIWLFQLYAVPFPFGFLGL